MGPLLANIFFSPLESKTPTAAELDATETPSLTHEWNLLHPPIGPVFDIFFDPNVKVLSIDIVICDLSVNTLSTLDKTRKEDLWSAEQIHTLGSIKIIVVFLLKKIPIPLYFLVTLGTH